MPRPHLPIASAANVLGEIFFRSGSAPHLDAPVVSHLLAGANCEVPAVKNLSPPAILVGFLLEILGNISTCSFGLISGPSWRSVRSVRVFDHHRLVGIFDRAGGAGRSGLCRAPVAPGERFRRLIQMAWTTFRVVAPFSSNDSVRLTMLAEGGHIAEILHKRSGVNPLWIHLGHPSSRPRIAAKSIPSMATTRKASCWRA